MIRDVTAHGISSKICIVGSSVSPARLHGHACIRCGTAKGKLVPAGQVGVREGEGIVRVWEVVACVRHTATGDRAEDRFEIAVFAEDARGYPMLWGVKERSTGDWACALDEDDEPTDPVSFALRSSAEEWARRQWEIDTRPIH